jgi:hypothetical protein
MGSTPLFILFMDLGNIYKNLGYPDIDELSRPFKNRR